MSYKIVIDSCGDLTEELKQDTRIERVPLELEIDGERILDDDTFNQKEYLKKIAESTGCAKTSCPSPERYMRAYETEAERVYVITLSANLSGSYNSAEVGRQMFIEKYGEKQIYVFNSCSACSAETLIARKVMELEEAGESFETIVEYTEKYIYDMGTYFILDDLETLRKNGRLTGIKAVVATTLNIKPVMGASKEGTIIQLGQAIGMKKAFHKLIDFILEDKKESNIEELPVMITNVNCRERAENVKKLLLEKIAFKDIRIVDAAGVSTTYANDGGIVVTL